MESPATTCDDDTSEVLADETPRKETESSEWTNEKHSRYLKNMETSFVDQLYKSMDIDDVSSRSVRYLDSGEFKVHRGGCWETISFSNPGSLPSPSNQRFSILDSAWIQHFRSSQKSKSILSPSSTAQTMSAKSCSKFKPPHASRTHSEVCVTEMSDQNFSDEQVEKHGVTRRPIPRRIKAMSKDQVVPRGKRPLSSK